MGMNFAKFNSVKAAVAKSGARVVSNAAAGLVVSSTYNRFILNDKAMKLLDVAEGDYVTMLDMAADPKNFEKDEEGVVIPFERDERYGIIKSKEGVGAKVAADGGFSYSGIWGAMMLNDGETSSADGKAVKEAGLAISTKGNKGLNYIATQKVTFALSTMPGEDGDAAIVDGSAFHAELTGTLIPVFQLTGSFVEDNDPKVKKDTIVD
jgi:hypothetical protein